MLWQTPPIFGMRKRGKGRGPGPGSLGTDFLFILLLPYLLLRPCVDAATYIPLTQAMKGSIISADALARSGRAEGRSKESSLSSSSPSSSHLRGRNDPTDFDKGTKDNASVAEAIHHPMTTLDPRLTAYFATLIFEGNQALQLLVDTGSPALLLPVIPTAALSVIPERNAVVDMEPGTLHPLISPSSSPSSPSSSPSSSSSASASSERGVGMTTRLDHTKAEATVLACEDPRCQGRCHTPDANHFCGPHGGSCQRSPLFPPALPPSLPPALPADKRRKEGGKEGGTEDMPENQCSFSWSFGAGQYSSQASGVLMKGNVSLGPLKVEEATFGAILEASPGFYPAPAAAGILGLSFGNNTLCGPEHTCWPPLLDSLPPPAPDAFTLCADGDRGAALVLGGVDHSLALGGREGGREAGREGGKKGGIGYVPMLPPFAHYWIRVKDLRIRGESLFLPVLAAAAAAAAAAGLEEGRRCAPSLPSSILVPRPPMPCALASRAAIPTVTSSSSSGGGGGDGGGSAEEATLHPALDDVPLDTAMVDSGNSATCFPEPVFDALRFRLAELVKDVPAVADVAGGQTLFDGYGRRLSVQELALLPSLDLVLEGEEVEGGEEGAGPGAEEGTEKGTEEGRKRRKEVVLTLTPADYLHNEGGFYFLKIIRYGHWAIGQTFLRRRYLEVDRANKRMGFAMPVEGCVPPSRGK